MITLHDTKTGIQIGVHPRRVVAVVDNHFTNQQTEELITATLIFVEGINSDKPFVVRESYDEIMEMLKGVK